MWVIPSSAIVRGFRHTGHRSASSSRAAGAPCVPAVLAARWSRTAAGAATWRDASRASAKHGGRRAIEHDLAAVKHDDAAADRGQQIGLLLDETIEAATGCEPRRAHRPPNAFPAGSSWAVGSSSTRCAGRSARSPAIATSCCWPPESRAGSRSASASIRRAARASSVRAITSSRGSAQVHRSEGDLLEDRRGHPGELGGRAGEGDADALRQLVHRQSGGVVAVEQDASGQRAADRARGEAGRDQAERRLARLGGDRRGRPPRRRAARGETSRSDGRAAPGIAVADALERQHQRSHSSQPSDPRDEQRRDGQRTAASGRSAGGRSPAGHHSSVRRPGRVKPRASSAIVRSSTSAIEPEDHRPGERARRRGAAPDDCPRCRGRARAARR